MTNYDLVMQGLTTHFFPPKALQRQKRYLPRGLFKPCDSKILKFICRINETVDYLEHLPPFGTSQGLPTEKFIEFSEFTLPRE